MSMKINQQSNPKSQNSNFSKFLSFEYSENLIHLEYLNSGKYLLVLNSASKEPNIKERNN